MKRLLSLLLVMATTLQFSFAQENNNLFWTRVVHVKKDKIAEFEKKLPVFLKTHYPQLSFRVYEIETGTNSGAYAVVTGPLSYKDLDMPMVSPKGDAARNLDDQALSSLIESQETLHIRRVGDISMVKPNRNIKFLTVTYREIKVGSWGEYLDILKRLKAARIAGDSKIDVDFFRPVASGNASAFSAVRFFDKWEEMDYEEKTADLYDKINGTGSWSRDIARLNEITLTVRSEIRILRPDLSTSK